MLHALRSMAGYLRQTSSALAGFRVLRQITFRIYTNRIAILLERTTLRPLRATMTTIKRSLVLMKHIRTRIRFLAEWYLSLAEVLSPDWESTSAQLPTFLETMSYCAKRICS